MKRILIWIGVFLLMVITIAAGSTLMVISLQLVSIEDITNTLAQIYASRDFRATLGISGFVLALLGYVIFQMVTLKMQREKTIAFTTPDGQVTVSLEAIENFIRRITKHLHGIKEIKPDVTADRKGLQIFARVTLLEETNIPDISEEIQRIARKKIQEMLGIEEPIRIRIHIVKIISREEPEKEIRDKEEEPFVEPVSPYRDYPEG